MPSVELQALQGVLSKQLPASARVALTGPTAPDVLPQLQAAGLVDILVVDSPGLGLQPRVKADLQESTCGNTLGVRVWEGVVEDMPYYLGPMEAFIFCGISSGADMRSALLRAALLLRCGGFIVISQAAAGDAEAHWRGIVHDLPLSVLSCTANSTFATTVLQVPPLYRFEGAPVRLEGPVVRGFGRGSRKMGTPTANIAPALLVEQLKALPKGVYFGWSQLDAPEGWSAADRGVHKMVLNIGSRPTLNDDPTDITVEVHILHAFPGDFYGSMLRVLALGFVRPEMRFSGLPALVSRIKADIAIARLQLDDPAAAALGRDAFP